MLSFCQLNRRQRINQRNRCEQLSTLMDWKLLNHYYTFARNQALRLAFPEEYQLDKVEDTSDFVRVCVLSQNDQIPVFKHYYCSANHS